MSAQVKDCVSPSGTVKVTVKKHRWYLGGIASAMAACCTHPLDLLKVHTPSKQFPSLRRGRLLFAFFLQALLRVVKLALAIAEKRYGYICKLKSLLLCVFISIVNELRTFAIVRS